MKQVAGETGGEETGSSSTFNADERSAAPQTWAASAPAIRSTSAMIDAKHMCTKLSVAQVLICHGNLHHNAAQCPSRRLHGRPCPAQRGWNAAHTFDKG